MSFLRYDYYKYFLSVVEIHLHYTFSLEYYCIQEEKNCLLGRVLKNLNITVDMALQSSALPTKILVLSI